MARKRAAGNGTSAKVTKADAVRQALAEGKDSPAEGVAFIKERYDIDISHAMFSSYKSSEKTRRNGRRKGGRRKAAAPAAEPTNKAAKSDNLVEAIASIQRLVGQFGAETVRGLVNLFK